MACSKCPGAVKPKAAAFARTGMRVRVSSDAEVAALRANNPGHSVTATILGPQSILVVMTPRNSV